MVFRVYVEKKQGFDVEAKQLANELKTILGIASLKNVRLVNRYDVEALARNCSHRPPLPCSVSRRSIMFPPICLISVLIMCLLWSICPVSSTSVRIPPAKAFS